jgi:nucleoside 2-deoxyribosyltransferase
VPQCPLCDSEVTVEPVNDIAGVTCPTCGGFTITGTAVQVLKNAVPPADRFKLSGLTRNSWEGQRRLRIDSSAIPDLLLTAPVPRNPFDALDRVLMLIHQHMPSLTGRVTIEWRDYPLVYARSRYELEDFLNHLEAQGFIQFRPNSEDEAWICSVTLSGWARIEEVRKLGRSSKQAFVAMWFDERMESAWTQGIHPALVEAGYSPVRMDLLAHNDKIDDRILVEIRRSGLLVADFTGHRGGVYFEAGFALGLGLPVIWCVREEEILQAHFDTRQYNHITWAEPAELKEKLFNRVVATLGVPS